MISDVPLGAFLSGGVDSSLVVAAMARLSPKIHTFSIRFAGPQVLDESPFARLVAQHCQTEHHEIVMDVEKVQALVPEVLNHFDEPFGDSSAVPTFLVSREARKHFTVALTGDGADEVFGGYRKYLGEHYLAKMGPYPLRRWLWKPLLGRLPTSRTHPLLETFRRANRLLLGDANNPVDRHINWLHPGPLPFSALQGTNLPSEEALRQRLRRQFPDQPSLNDCLRLDQSLVLAGDMLVKLDRMSMKASLELRSPFLDHRLVRFANQLPVEQKIRGTQRKIILREKLGHLLPEAIFNRPKSGFEMPIGAWLRGPMRAWAEQLLFHTCDTREFVDQEALKQVWNRHQSGKLDATEPLWFQLVFANWLNRYQRGAWFGD